MPMARRSVPYTQERRPSIISISSDSSTGTIDRSEETYVTEQQDGCNVDAKDADIVKDEESDEVADSEGHHSLLAAVKEHVHCGICCELLWDPYIMYVHSFRVVVFGD
ncbi:hypothetical protein V5O48_012715 [Marasmius crinis-equi]|uniref:Uncharacterized protein n=1 Tax=Marasmius crinis-equi TaxID=585013 RepID=A0ABR3F218_9AGAR